MAPGRRDDLWLRTVENEEGVLPGQPGVFPGFPPGGRENRPAEVVGRSEFSLLWQGNGSGRGDWVRTSNRLAPRQLSTCPPPAAPRRLPHSIGVFCAISVSSSPAMSPTAAEMAVNHIPARWTVAVTTPAAATRPDVLVRKAFLCLRRSLVPAFLSIGFSRPSRTLQQWQDHETRCTGTVSGLSSA